MTSRALGRVTTLATVLAVTGATALASVASVASSHPVSGRFDLPRDGFAPASTVLRDSTPEHAGLDAAPITAAERALTAWTADDAVDGHPLFSGGVGLLAHDGKIVDTHVAGEAVRYADGSGTELPEGAQVPMRENTIFDMASVTKLFTSIAVMQLVERGEVELTAPAARYLPEFGVNGKESITVRQLLTHTSGLEPTLSLWRDWPDEASRIKAVMDVEPESEPGTAYTYSDLNLITLGVLVERLTGSSLDEVVADRITRPLGMRDTGYNPPKSKLDRIAATEFQSVPDRGMVRGEVHDENAWSLGGVAGHAGIFSTAHDMAVLGQTILNGGTYRGAGILEPRTVSDMLTNFNEQFPDDSHGLGFELDQIWYMGGLTSPVTAGHTGYTGTTLVIDPLSRSLAILLTNRVHPSREWGSINPARELWATSLSRAMAVPAKHGGDSWFSGLGNDGVATLTTPEMPAGNAPSSVSFDTFVDSESTDPLVLEARVGGEWKPVPLRASGPGAPSGTVESLSGTGHRAWWKVTATVPAADKVAVRWRFTTDENYTARGVQVDGLRISGPNGVLLDGERTPEALTASGFELSKR